MEVIPGVHQITDKGVNIFLIVEDRLTLIDTGFRGSYSKIRNLVHSLGRSLEDISLMIITHNHPDHVGGVEALRRVSPAKVAIQKADTAITRRDWQLPRLIKGVQRIPPFSGLVGFLFPELHRLDILLNGGEVLAPLGGLEVIHTPGHTPGSISLFAPKRRLLIVGDSINGRHNDLRLAPESVSHNVDQLYESMKGIAKLDFDVICFGHGKPRFVGAKAEVGGLFR